MDATSGQQIQPWAAGVMVMLVLNFWCFHKDLVVTVFLPSFAVAAQAGGHQLDFNFSSAYSTENPLLTVGAIAGGEALRPSTLAQPEVR
jgi:hypothetical protein